MSHGARGRSVAREGVGATSSLDMLIINQLQ